ncbi:MAG: hypothetical protein AAGD25_33375 [Cyanobacteria bacterium P01_F01_bin.150]
MKRSCYDRQTTTTAIKYGSNPQQCDLVSSFNGLASLPAPIGQSVLAKSMADLYADVGGIQAAISHDLLIAI